MCLLNGEQHGARQPDCQQFSCSAKCSTPASCRLAEACTQDHAAHRCDGVGLGCHIPVSRPSKLTLTGAAKNRSAEFLGGHSKAHLSSRLEVERCTTSEAQTAL